MYCHNCGTQNDDNAWKCVSCGTVLQTAAPQAAGPSTGSIPNYLIPSILVTIFCCWPAGIPAIVFAAQVNTKLAQGDVGGALESSRKAKMWTWIAFGVGLGLGLIYLVFFVVTLVMQSDGGSFGELLRAP